MVLKRAGSGKTTIGGYHDAQWFSAAKKKKLAYYALLHVSLVLVTFSLVHAQVYGVEWSAGQESYSVYGNWRSTKQQREEMLKPDIVKGLQQCCV